MCSRNKVSIDILDTLLDNNLTYLHLFALDFLKIIRLLLEGDDHALIISGATDVFIKYCQAANHDDIYYINDDLMRSLNRILSQLSELSQYQSSNERKDALKQYEIQSAGLRGLQALASLETFRGLGVAKRMVDFWDAVFYNVPFEDGVKVGAGTIRVPPHTSLVKPNLLSEDVTVFESTSSLALKCIITLVNRSTATTISVLIVPFFEIIQKESKYLDLGVKIIEKILKELDKRHLYAVVNKILDFARERQTSLVAAKLFLKTAPIFIAYLDQFPIAAVLEPMVNIAIESKEGSEISKSLDAFIDDFLGSQFCRKQSSSAITFLINKSQALVKSKNGQADSPLVLLMRILDKFPAESLSLFEIDDWRILLELSGNDNQAKVRSISLQVIQRGIELSNGLQKYRLAQKVVLDMLFGGLIYHMDKISSNGFAIAKSFKMLNADEDMILVYSLPHIISLLPKTETEKVKRVTLEIIIPYLDTLCQKIGSSLTQMIKDETTKQMVRETLKRYRDFVANEVPTSSDTISILQDEGSVFITAQELLSVVKSSELAKRISDLNQQLERKLPVYSVLPIKRPPVKILTSTSKEKKKVKKNSYEYDPITGDPKPVAAVVTESFADFKESLARLSSNPRPIKRPRRTRLSHLDMCTVTRASTLSKKKFKEFEALLTLST